MVIILNPNDELKIIEFQNNFIKNLNLENNYICKHFPLWINLSFLQNDNLQEISKNITYVEIDNLKENFCADVKIIFKNKEYKSELKLFDLYSSEKIKDFENAFSLTKNIFPLKISIFRIGIEHKIGRNAFSIKDYVWKKIKKDDF